MAFVQMKSLMIPWVARGPGSGVDPDSACSAGTLALKEHVYERLSGSPHPNVVAVMGACVDAPDGKLRIVMRLCPKGSLDDLLVKARETVRSCSRRFCESDL